MIFYSNIVSMKNDFFPDYCFSKRFSLALKSFFFVRRVLSLCSSSQNCIVCGGKTDGSSVCKNCRKIFFKADFSSRCRKCGKELISEVDFCTSCKTSPVISSCDGVFPLLSYRLWRKNILFSWKIEEKRELSPFLSYVVFQALTSLEKKFGCSFCVVPVPPRPGKIREKGWDQIDELCMFLEKYWSVRVLKILRRLSKVQQKKLDRFQRLEAIYSSYDLKSRKIIKKIAGAIPEKVILLDDVLTTGSTVEACASLLKKLGVKKVYVLTLFVVD